MDLFEQGRGRPSARRGIQLQGPRPTPSVSKDSHKIKKPSSQPDATKPPLQRRPPVIIYTVSPKIIHTKPNEFMSLVQRLTGWSSPADSSGCDSRRLNQNLNAEQKSKEGEADELRRLVGGGTLPGFLSSTSAQPISPSFFSPTAAVDINQLNFFQELNPGLHGGKSMVDNGYMAGPCNFFFSL
ncbi:hypothetical protein HPP92_002823 [Vanilla planifolia]|uniref:VQ domain-containing protein n=1 Tax=Vanilla planifolia TaxID=51239 RepID=A0A835VJ73_VANPL|nr:hypothetical protein HPP92_003212 [Vanilla planifolia]KAG0502751.1 hypothetical protein HPP92_002823 [Vanilla planifolia]